MNKVIYLPKQWGDGQYSLYGFPRLIYVFRYRKGNPIGSAHEREAEAKRGKEYPAQRCLPFTEANWEHCQQHIQRRVQLNEEYETFLKLAKRTRLTKDKS